METFAGKVAVITGGASGIGLGLARSLMREGAHVVLADIDEAALANALAELPGALGVVTNVADEASVMHLADEALGGFGGVDLVCANAGVTGPTGPRLWEVTRPEWDAVIGVNLVGVINTLCAFVPILVERGEGHVLITSSMAGLTRASVLPAYWATKHAIVALAETLQSQLADAAPAVGVSVLTPGGVRTNLGGSRTDADDASKGVPGRSDRIIEPDECAAITLDAIRAGRFYVVTHPEGVTRVQNRVDSILGDFADAARRLGS